MNTEDQNQDFEKLQHLLKLKQYEAPPPRYFNDFSGSVVSRIRAGSSGERYEAFENLVTNTPWLRRLWQKLERQPAISGAIAAAACGLMFAGVFLLETTTPQNIVFNPAATEAAPAASDFATPANNHLLAAGHGTTTSNSPAVNLFEELSSMRTLPATAVGGMPLWQRPNSNAVPLFPR